jgi:hypothetical protein
MYSSQSLRFRVAGIGCLSSGCNRQARTRLIGERMVLPVLALIGLLIGMTGAHAAGRVALVLVAEDYQRLQRSVVGLKRGRDVADALTARGFDTKLSNNPSNAESRANLRDFSVRIKGADIAIVVLIGHGTSSAGQTFFLPVNTEITRATDLLSRGLSIGSVAQITGGAAQGGVFVFMTVPRFDTPVEGLDARPQFLGEPAQNVFAVFANSSKMPVSRFDVISVEGADALAAALRRPEANLRDLVRAAASGELGLVAGNAPEQSLSAVPVAPAPTKPAAGTDVAPAAQQADADLKLKAERLAREQTEQKLRDEQAKAEQAKLTMSKAQAELEKAQADARKAQADAERARADAEVAKANVEQARADADNMRLQTEALTATTKAQIERANAKAAETTAAAQAAAQPGSPLANPIDERLLGQKQRQLIQSRLHALSLYTGPIDSVMGPLTREAIMGFQRSRRADVTGFLTPDQFNELTLETK